MACGWFSSISFRRCVLRRNGNLQFGQFAYFRLEKMQSIIVLQFIITHKSITINKILFHIIVSIWQIENAKLYCVPLSTSRHIFVGPKNCVPSDFRFHLILFWFECECAHARFLQIKFEIFICTNCNFHYMYLHIQFGIWLVDWIIWRTRCTLFICELHFETFSHI